VSRTLSIRFDNVTKRYGDSTAVEGLTLETQEGEFVVLLGPSGCGKSTTLRLVAGLEEATSGDIFLLDQRINDVPTRYRDVAMVFQNYALYPHMTVAGNIGYPLRVKKLAITEIEASVRRVAAMLEIEALLGRKPRDLSGGERQRVALARAIVREPRLYLMDEPLSNLDARLRVQMRREIKRLQRGLGTTTLYVTHDQAEAMTLADRVAVMRGGRLQQFDTPLNIYNLPANQFVAEFVGSPSMNFIVGRLDGDSRRFTGSGISLRLSDSQLKRTNGHGNVTLGIRPEHLKLSTAGGDEWLPATVYVTEMMGNETLVFLRLGEQKLVARAASDFRADIESRLWVQLEMEKADFFDSESGNALR
jgi:multiple sugar transport system ATP-binding protein